MFLYWLFAVVMPLLTAACNHRLTIPGRTCDCEIGYRGCRIVEPAPPGFKCYCWATPSSCHGLYGCIVSPARCHGTAYPCRNYEACPGGQLSYCSCILGGGDCDGYRRWLSAEAETCPTLPEVTPLCECAYYRNVGCYITEPALEGFKCECYETYTGCAGVSIGCDEDEFCPADDTSYCGCKRGGGNCDGYQYDPMDPVCEISSTCNCDRRNDWSKGRYYVTKTTFDSDNSMQSNQRPFDIGSEIDLPNASDAEQTKMWIKVYTLTSESSFERTHGISVALGIQFSAIIPITATTSHSFTYGEKITTSNETRLTLSCTSPPKTHTKCKINVMSYDITVPYTMHLKHKQIPDCVCESSGNYRSTSSIKGQTTSETISKCYRIISGKCDQKP